MKGFKDKSGKFRPIENKNGVRKSRDQSAKTEGVRMERDYKGLGGRICENCGKVNSGIGSASDTCRCDNPKPRDSHVIDPYHFQKEQSKQMRKDVTSGKISEQDYLKYYYSIPSNLRKHYGVPKTAPKFASYFTNPRMQREGEKDPHEGGQAVLDTLFASSIKGKPFFVASGIKDFVLFGENEVMFNKIPKNPNHIAKITVLVDRGSDSFTARFYHKDEFLPALEEKGLYVDQLAPALANGLGIEH